MVAMIINYQKQQLMTTGIYSLTVLEIRRLTRICLPGLKSRCCLNWFLLGSEGRESISLPLPPSGGFLHSLACGRFFHLQIHHSSLCFSPGTPAPPIPTSPVSLSQGPLWRQWVHQDHPGTPSQGSYLLNPAPQATGTRPWDIRMWIYLGVILQFTRRLPS